ncbi:MAG: hypothetical protein GEV06_26475 [Luteitalea sp.]|nr:hypothetical protein [Luteitalea sp.]
MRKSLIGLALIVGVVSVDVMGQRRGEMVGFSSENAERTRAAERVMATVPDAATMGGYHRDLTRRPHHAGSEQNYLYAVYLRDKLEEFGYETEMVKYDVWIPWPRDMQPMKITLTAPTREEISTVEPPIDGDPDTFVEGTADTIARYLDDLIAIDRDGKVGQSIRDVATATARFRGASVAANGAFEDVLGKGSDWLDGQSTALHVLNGLIMQAERDFLDERGLPRRPNAKLFRRHRTSQ